MRRLPDEPPAAEITPESLYPRRREFLKNAAAFAATERRRRRGASSRSSASPAPRRAAEGRRPAAPDRRPRSRAPRRAPLYTLADPRDAVRGRHHLQQLLRARPRTSPTPRENAGTLKPRPWTVTVEGEVKKPQRPRPRHAPRLVPARGARLPHALRRGLVDGHPLARLPARRRCSSGSSRPRARSTWPSRRCSTPSSCPAQRDAVLAWPYVEGLRIDEAMHPLTLLAVGLYGKALPNQNGAPLRLVVPWKYGFKGIKSIVKIRFTEHAAAQAPGTAAAPRRVRLLREREPRRSTTRAGARRPSGASASSAAAADAAVQRLRRRRWRRCTRAWTCGENF